MKSFFIKRDNHPDLPEDPGNHVLIEDDEDLTQAVIIWASATKHDIKSIARRNEYGELAFYYYEVPIKVQERL